MKLIQIDNFLIDKNSFIFESVEKGIIRGRYTIIGFNPDKSYNIKKNRIIVDDFKKKIVIKKNVLSYLNNLLKTSHRKLLRMINQFY